MSDLWRALRPEARQQLSQRDYSAASVAERLASCGVEARELLDRAALEPAWIPGVEVLPRKIYPQRHRGFFGEMVRMEEGRLAEIGLWPRQWATARMFAGSAKGFHIHPPYVPADVEPTAWFQQLFITEPEDFSRRPYAQEQWDVMFFVSGAVEMLLVDERSGLPRRAMRFIIEGDDHRGPNNVGVVIPAGVAHALRVEGPGDGIMVYGTSTKFDPQFEGRISDSIERPSLPGEWEVYLRGTGGDRQI